MIVSINLMFVSTNLKINKTDDTKSNVDAMLMQC